MGCDTGLFHGHFAGGEQQAHVLDVPMQLQEGAGQDEAAGPGEAQQRVQEGEEPQVRGGAAAGEGEEEGEIHALQDA